ncbi:hypothetical protein LIER_30140 [Lithospermum erythrorhizon]|uniref:Uncharacterized protein n=1 Tax=Lithospermum erythrorhizon TaxID=34254 RepID=A0AAV3RLR6_LITER
MSFLPMEDVVRPSLLLLGGHLSGKLVASIFVSMTYSELLLNKKSVYRREPYSDMTYSQNLDNWVATGIARNVKNFRIGGYSGYLSDNESINSKFRYPSVMFMSNSLETLDFSNIGTLDPPRVVRLPNVKTLRLVNVDFSSDESIERFISGCTSC